MSMQLSIFKTPVAYNKAENRRLILAFFLTAEISPLILFKKSVIKTFKGDFLPCSPPENL